MPSYEDLVQAKKVLSSSLLRAGLQGNVMGMASTLRVAESVARASNNVHAVGIGFKYVNGKATDTLCVRIYVVQKLPESMLAPFSLLRKSIAGIETDVIEAPPAFAVAKKKIARKKGPKRKAVKKAKLPKAQDADDVLDVPPGGIAGAGGGFERSPQRPVVAGISAGHFNTTGTLGYFCRSLKVGEANDVFVLSNNHVFGNRNESSAGDNLVQPGLFDGGNPSDHHFAELQRIVPLNLGGTVPNRVDAALGRLLPNIAHQVQIHSIGAVAGIMNAANGLRVRKHGRTTGLTVGVVTDLAVDALIGMDPADPSVVARFDDQIRVAPAAPFTAWGKPGDSGSLVVSEDNPPRAVGLHFAGPPDGSYGLANHILDVLNEMDISLIVP